MRHAFRTVNGALAAAVLTAALTACGHGGEREPVARLEDTRGCTPVDVVAAPETARPVGSLAREFNRTDAARTGTAGCVWVRVHTVGSGRAAELLDADWADAPEALGPAPALWVPASGAWVALANERAAARGQAPVAGDGPSFARSPTVIAMPEPMARALGWPEQPVGWATLARLAADPRGWASTGHPEWGAFKLGKADPNLDDSALLQTIATNTDVATATALEASVVYYGDASWPFLDTWWRLDQKGGDAPGDAPGFASAVVTDARTVLAYDRGSPNGVVPAKPREKLPKVPLVAITPDGSPSASDNPMAPVLRPWVSPDARQGAEAFTRFATGPAATALVAKEGFEPGGSPVAAYTGVDAVLADWEARRKQGRLLLLVDVSASMGDRTDPRDDDSPTKMDLAKIALLRSLGALSDDDDVGLRTFTTGPDDELVMQDVVPIGPLGAQREAIEAAIVALRPQIGSPLYAAERAAFATMESGFDPVRINGVVTLTDSHNEYDPENDRKELLARLHPPVRMFGIAYSDSADLGALRRIAQATNSRAYDATNPQVVSDAVYAAVSNF